MTHNEILRLIKNTFDLTETSISEIFSLADSKVTEETISAWFKPVQDEDYILLTDKELAVFLNGFINLKRGKREGEQPEVADKLNNNMVFQKLRIALNLKAEDILAIFELVDLDLSKHEISAFFRKQKSKHYRPCKDFTLQKFLQGVKLQG